MKNIYVAFMLTMPNCGSWNGKWTGENKIYAKIWKTTESQAKNIIDKDYLSEVEK